MIDINKEVKIEITARQIMPSSAADKVIPDGSLYIHPTMFNIMRASVCIIAEGGCQLGNDVSVNLTKQHLLRMIYEKIYGGMRYDIEKLLYDYKYQCHNMLEFENRLWLIEEIKKLIPKAP